MTLNPCTAVIPYSKLIIPSEFIKFEGQRWIAKTAHQTCVGRSISMSIVDGHIILSRELTNQYHYPELNFDIHNQKSVSTEISKGRLGIMKIRKFQTTAPKPGEFGIFLPNLELRYIHPQRDHILHGLLRDGPDVEDAPSHIFVNIPSIGFLWNDISRFKANFRASINNIDQMISASEEILNELRAIKEVENSPSRVFESIPYSRFL
jgi:hypothetical protein